MIKFFRGLRKRLIIEGRLSKYLIYAFGEILLVVAGILIALQVNALYEDKKNRQTEQSYVE